MAKTTTLKEFESVFPKLVEDILDHAKQYNLPEEFVQWYKTVSKPSQTLQSCKY
jgi:farnesyl diphosphate synthase